MRFWQILLAIMAFALVLVQSPVARADHTARPVGDVILTVLGPMTQTNAPDGASFDLDMLQKIGTVTFSTTTPWTDGVQSFTGVPLIRLLAHIGASAQRLSVRAINEYQIDIPASDAVEGGPILAWDQGGKLLSARDKGPLWLIYPFDAKPEYSSEKIHSRAVWQVVRIDLIP